MRNVPRWLWRILQIATFVEGLEWIAVGVLGLVLATVVWLRPPPPIDDALIVASIHYRALGASLLAAFGFLLIGGGLREAITASRGRA